MNAFIFAPHLIIQNLELLSGRNQKENLLKDSFLYFETNPNFAFKELLRLCLDPFTTFGIKNIPIKEDNNLGTNNNEFEELYFNYTQTFINDLLKLSLREVTGHDAITLVHNLMNQCPTKEIWNMWFRRILLKDLKCGADVKTINKVYKHTFNVTKDLVYLFECQLAQDSTKQEQKMIGKKLVSAKLDGVRVLAIIHPNKEIKLYSRNGKELHNFNTIVESLKEGIDYTKLVEAIVLDGEVMSSSFQDLMKQIYRKEAIDTNDATYYIFDYIPLKAFQQGYYEVTQNVRIDQLNNLVIDTKVNNIKLLHNKEVDLSTSEGQEQFKQINNEAIQNKFEGLMIKDPNAPYECKRTTSWLKLKPFIEVSLQVIAIEEGTGKNIGKLGALTCKGFDLDSEIEVSVGGGFTDEQRDLFWLHKEALLNHIVEIRADAITLNQHNQTDKKIYSLRFPRFLKFRSLDIGEKI